MKIFNVYNSLTNQIEPLKPIRENEISMYVCGPTVYGDIHIGNCRPVIVFDVLYRVLSYIGYKVTYMSNITDVDDKIIKKALEENVSESEIAISPLTIEEKELLCGISAQLQTLSEEEWKIMVSSNGFYGFDKILPYLDEETKSLIKNYMNEYRYYVIMNEQGSVTKEEFIECKHELEEVIRRLRSKDKCILDDILKYSDAELQLILRYIDNFTLATALKGTKEEIVDCFLRNLSLRFKYMIQEEMEYMGPLRISEIEMAQKKILQIAQNLFTDR